MPRPRSQVWSIPVKVLTGDEELAPLKNENILAELECPICQEYMYPPIQQCTTGHSMCELCFAKVSDCPTCRCSKGSTRNLALESIHSKVLVPCKYKEFGCTVLKIGAEIRMHQEFCEFGEKSCPLKDSSKCTWVGKPKELFEHAKTIHDEHLININKYTTYIKHFAQKSGEGKHYKLINACGKIFKCCVNLDFSSNIIGWCIMYVGPREQANDYSYLIEFIDLNELRSTEKYAIVATCQPLVKDNQIFTSKSTAIVYFDRLKEFCSLEQHLYFHLKVFPTKRLSTCV